MISNVLLTSLQESSSLDYKKSASLDKKKRDEICKDVSSFANSAGGQIVYGVEEKSEGSAAQIPVAVDVGTPIASLDREWVENTLLSCIHPPIEGLIITPIPFDDKHERFGYVITIPQATRRAPHQAPDGVYYRRHNFKSAPMHDHEVRDAFRRSLAYGREYAVVWTLRNEARRISSVASRWLESAKRRATAHPRTPWEPDKIVSILPEVRGVGLDVRLINPDLRQSLQGLLMYTDDYNALIQGGGVIPMEHVENALQLLANSSAQAVVDLDQYLIQQDEVESRNRLAAHLTPGEP
jgi:hypothetical protein